MSPAALTSERRGCLTLPEPECCYLPVGSCCKGSPLHLGWRARLPGFIGCGGGALGPAGAHTAANDASTSPTATLPLSHAPPQRTQRTHLQQPAPTPCIRIPPAKPLPHLPNALLLRLRARRPLPAGGTRGTASAARCWSTSPPRPPRPRRPGPAAPPSPSATLCGSMARPSWTQCWPAAAAAEGWSVGGPTARPLGRSRAAARGSRRWCRSCERRSDVAARAGPF